MTDQRTSSNNRLTVPTPGSSSHGYGGYKPKKLNPEDLNTEDQQEDLRTMQEITRRRSASIHSSKSSRSLVDLATEAGEAREETSSAGATESNTSAEDVQSQKAKDREGSSSTGST